MRSYAKPFGYAGDFRIMNQVYELGEGRRHRLSSS